MEYQSGVGREGVRWLRAGREGSGFQSPGSRSTSYVIAIAAPCAYLASTCERKRKDAGWCRCLRYLSGRDEVYEIGDGPGADVVDVGNSVRE